MNSTFDNFSTQQASEVAATLYSNGKYDPQTETSDDQDASLEAMWQSLLSEPSTQPPFMQASTSATHHAVDGNFFDHNQVSSHCSLCNSDHSHLSFI